MIEKPKVLKCTLKVLENLRTFEMYLSTSNEYLPEMYLSTFQVLYKLYLSTYVLKYKVLLPGSASIQETYKDTAIRYSKIELPYSAFDLSSLHPSDF